MAWLMLYHCVFFSVSFFWNLCHNHHWRMLAQAYLHLQFKLSGRSWVEPSREEESWVSSLRQRLVQRVVEDISETWNLRKETC